MKYEAIEIYEYPIKVDAEFCALIPPLSELEFSQLRANLVEEGCRDPLVVWRDDKTDGRKVTLLDGHNRYEICSDLAIEFKVVAIELSDREAAKDWIDANQLGRRNLTPDQLSIIRGRRYNRTKNKAGAPIGNDNASKQCAQNEHIESERTCEQLAESMGVSQATIRRDGKKAEAFDKLAEVAPEKASQILSGKKRFNEVQREIRREEHAQKVEIAKTSSRPQLSDSHEIILADPPWRYDFSETEAREIENHYPSASLEEIASHIPKSAASDCILLLWATSPKLLAALSTMETWGFEYKTHAIWDKQKIGMGYWFRGQHELLLVGTKGKPGTVPECARTTSIFTEPRGKHSAKPECVYKWIEHAFPLMTKLEMYSRTPRVGWDSWGNEV